MATTSKPRKKRKVAKKVTKNVIKKTTSKKILDHLELEDLRQLENLSKDVHASRLEMNVEEQSLRNMSLEYQLMEHKIAKQKQAVSQKALMFEQRKEKYRTYKESISPKYGLKNGEGLGYDPDTGKIVR